MVKQILEKAFQDHGVGNVCHLELIQAKEIGSFQEDFPHGFVPVCNGIEGLSILPGVDLPKFTASVLGPSFGLEGIRFGYKLGNKILYP